MVDGDTDWGSLMAGQSAAMVSEILPAKTIIANMFADAEKVLSRIGEVKA